MAESSIAYVLRYVYKNLNELNIVVFLYFVEDSNKIVKGFQVLYHTMRRGKYDINKQFCVQVGKNVSLTFSLCFSFYFLCVIFYLTVLFRS